MAAVDDVVAVTVKAKWIPTETPTKAALEAEAAALGDSFSEVTSHEADLVADAEELLRARADANELQTRGYRVSDGQFERVKLLVELLVPLHAAQNRQIEAGKAKTAAAEAARARLIAIRSELGLIGRAAGLPASVFSLETSSTQRLNVVMMKMDEVLENVRAYREHLPDKQRLDALVTEARNLIDEQKGLRRDARLIRTDTHLDGRKTARFERMLLDVMQHLSAQGLAAYSADKAREPLYRLDHVYGRRPSKVGDPGANDGQPTPEA